MRNATQSQGPTLEGGTDPLARSAVDQSAWFGFGVPVLVTFAVAGAAIAVGGVLFVVWEWRKLVRSVTPRFRGARHAR